MKTIGDRKLPQFVLLMGGVGSGKTTMRRQRYAEGYVHIDASEIFALLGGGDSEFPGPFERELEVLGRRITMEAVGEQKDIVMEIIGDSPDMIESMTQGLRSIGYEVHAQVLTCSPEEGMRRSRHAGETDTSYVSAYFTQELHHRWLLAAIEDSKRKKK